MIEYIVLLITLFYFIIASLEDIKKREVYDYINYSLSFFIIGISIFDSIYLDSLDPMKYVGFGLLIGFFIGSVLYYLGIWGGGDAKFLIGFSGASFYLLKFYNSNSYYNLIYNFIITKMKIFFSYFINYFMNILMIFDLIFILVGIFTLSVNLKNKKRRKNLLDLNMILFLLFIGLFFEFNSSILILIGFIVFVLIFISEEDIFNSIYFKYIKSIDELKEGDFLLKKLKKNGKELVSEDSILMGLDKKDLDLIKKNLNPNDEIFLKKILPYSILIGLNFVVYILKIINLDKMNLLILEFLLKFLFFSFISGGIITILILIYSGIKNHKKIKFKISRNIKIILIISFLAISFLALMNHIFFSLYLILLLYPIFKLSKEIEKISFIKKKNIKDIVPGDWIAEDIIINGKLLYSVEDFKLGINENQLETIKKLSNENKNFKKIYVKDGIAFLPPLLIGFILTLLI